MTQLQTERYSNVAMTDVELNYNLKLISLLQPKTIVEIGSNDGAHIAAISSMLKGAKHEIISIDPWISNHKQQLYEETIAVLRNRYRNIKYYKIKGKSQSKSVKAEVEKLLKRKHLKVDFLFIDGAHDEYSVLADWNNYQRFVSGKGVICFHDVIAYKGVKLAWQKITELIPNSYSTVVVNKGGIFLPYGSKSTGLGLGYIFK